MATMTAQVPSSDGKRAYALVRHDDGSWSCSCPAWRNVRMPNDQRQCKHMQQLVNDLGRHVVGALDSLTDVRAAAG